MVFHCLICFCFSHSVGVFFDVYLKERRNCNSSVIYQGCSCGLAFLFMFQSISVCSIVQVGRATSMCCFLLAGGFRGAHHMLDWMREVDGSLQGHCFARPVECCLVQP